MLWMSLTLMLPGSPRHAPPLSTGCPPEGPQVVRNRPRGDLLREDLDKQWMRNREDPPPRGRALWTTLVDEGTRRGGEHAFSIARRAPASRPGPSRLRLESTDEPVRGCAAARSSGEGPRPRRVHARAACARGRAPRASRAAAPQARARVATRPAAGAGPRSGIGPSAADGRLHCQANRANPRRLRARPGADPSQSRLT